MINNPYDYLVMRVGHALTSNLPDKEILDCIRISYREAFFPEKGILPHEISLLKKLYAESLIDDK